VAATGLSVAGAPSAAADDRASFNLTWGATYYRGTVDFYNRSVVVSGQLRGLSTGCRRANAYSFNPLKTLDSENTSLVCNGPVVREIPLSADAAGGASMVSISLRDPEGRYLTFCVCHRGDEYCVLGGVEGG
jgi:hypothetical protein